jgi:hypothetical protein
VGCSPYWTVVYPLSVGLSGIIGWFLRGRGWIAGVIISLAQMPMVLNSGTGPLYAVGLLFLILLTIPAASFSALSGRLASRGQQA